MNEHDELLTKLLQRLKNNYFTDIKSVLSESDKPVQVILDGINNNYTPDVTAVKAGKVYILEVETAETLKMSERDPILKAISKYAETNNFEFVVAVPVASFMDAGKKLSQLKADASIWDMQ
jgi:phosphoribosylformylglycinamidine (FGAM) synthase PurS component